MRSAFVEATGCDRDPDVTWIFWTWFLSPTRYVHFSLSLSTKGWYRVRLRVWVGKWERKRRTAASSLRRRRCWIMTGHSPFCQSDLSRGSVSSSTGCTTRSFKELLQFILTRHQPSHTWKAVSFLSMNPLHPKWFLGMSLILSMHIVFPSLTVQISRRRMENCMPLSLIWTKRTVAQ